MDAGRFRTVAEAYGRGAAVYERLWAPALLPLCRELVASLPLPDAARVLDAGTGAGTLLPTLGAAAPGALVVGVDATPDMLRRGPPGFPRAVMDLQALALSADTFDGAVAAFVLFHVADPPRALRELCRVLRPGGVLGTITWRGDPDFVAQRVWTEELDRHGAAPAAATTNHAGLDSVDAMGRSLRAAGFEPGKGWEQAFAHRHSPDSFLDLRSALGASGGRFASLPPARRRAVLDAARRRLERLDEADLVDANRAIFHLARKPRVACLRHQPIAPRSCRSARAAVRSYL